MSSSAIALFGGTFDPIHLGHLAVAQLALESLHLSEVIFIPTAHNPLKGVDTTGRGHRLRMVEQAVEGYSHFSVWAGEVTRGGESYTVETLRYFKELHPNTQIYFVIGADSVEGFHHWYKAQEILSLVTLAVVQRPGFELCFDPSLPIDTFVEIPSPHWGISSTTLREYLKDGFSCEFLLQKTVQQYIKQHKIYV